MRADRLGEVPFFGTMQKKQLELLARETDEVDVRAGEVLTREGDIGHEFFVIDSGTAEVTRGDQRVAELGPGDFFGEIALLREDRRTATVTATSPMTVVVMTRSSFRAMDASMPGVHETVERLIEERSAANREPAA